VFEFFIKAIFPKKVFFQKSSTFPKNYSTIFKPNSFKVGLGISQTNADSDWKSVYNAFHRFFCCGNEKIRQ